MTRPGRRPARRIARGAGRRAALLAIGLALSVGVGACGGEPGPTPNVLPSSLATPAPTAGSGGTAASPSPEPSGSEAAASPPPGGAVIVDQSLLSFIPIGGHGLIQTVDPDTTAQVAQDPDLEANATGLMIATYIPDATLSSAPPGDELAVVSVVRLRDPSADDTWFRGWRESYDDAACANAGGVARNSQTDIGTHTVFIGVCKGGAFTYHTRLARGAIVISITSIGSLQIGQTIMERLAP